MEVLVDHALVVIAVARPLVGAIGIEAALFAVLAEFANRRCQTGRVVGAEVHRVVAPDLAETGNVIGDNGAARERSFKRFHSHGLVARGSGIDGRTAIKIAKLRLSLRSLQRHTQLVRGNLDVGSNRNARHTDRLIRSYDTNGERVLVLRQQVHLPAGIEQPSHRKNRVLLADIRIEKYRITTVV